ncbi:MAG: hypothetical protein CMP21_00840 [Rickettsiales bacterium]|nr:hypothetical protein [Rickettsiales bacterium]|tara:strand:+ start:4750 stop:5862 length:1113 start_codon:yes stop_codon:yes gene_type:complete
MLIYWLIFVFLSILAFLNLYIKDKSIKFVFFIFIMFFLILFAGLRGETVSADYLRYVMFFEMTPNIMEWVSGDYQYSIVNSYMVEPLYLLIGAFVKVFTTNYVFNFLFISFIAVSINSIFYFKYSKYVFLTVLLYFVFTFFGKEMTQIRNGVSSALGLFLIFCFYKKLHLRSLIIIATASLIHLASICYLIPFFVNFFRERLTNKVIIGFIALGMALGYVGILKSVIVLLPDSFLKVKLYNYAFMSKYADITPIFDLVNIKNILFLSIFLIFRNKLSKKVIYFDVMLMMYALGVFFRLLFSDVDILAGRLASYFTIVEVIMIPSLILLFKQRIFIFFLIVFYAGTIFNMQLNLHNRQSYYISNKISEIFN